ncbi:F-box protein PP2-B1-like, partial [Capsicum annuum]|uniref:F-box protein PP2-B1-like n=1 Tax=Capsicum annuum TaxID=4072 RepID=UPI001FB0AC33
WWLEIRGTIRVGVLSPRTSYVAYLVYKLNNEYGQTVVFLEPEGRPQSNDDYEESVYALSSDAEDDTGLHDDDDEEPEQPDDDYEEAMHTLPSDAEDDTGLHDDEPKQPDDDYEEAVYILPTYGEEDLVEDQHLPEDASSLVQSNIRCPQLRDDGWFEIELGEFYIENEDDCIEMSFKEVKDCVSSKEGLIVEGIKIRPRM